MEIWPGTAYPLGATYDGSGVNFALFSEVAERVELCLIDDEGAETRLDLPEVDGFVWHGHVPGLRPGQLYGYRVHGPYDPSNGHRCDPNKLLLDPYAKAIDGADPERPGAVLLRLRRTPTKRNTDDSLGKTLLGVVTSPFFDWGHDRPPRHEYHESVIYEAHVKGLTMTHPDIPEEIRGTYAGIGHPAIIDHLTDLGVTAIELMPVHQFVQDTSLQAQGLSQLLGLQHHRLPRAPQRLRRCGPAGPAGHRVQGDGQGAPRGRHRGHPRRRLQPHGRGQRQGPDASASGASTTRPTTASSTTPRSTTTTRRAPATACSCATRTCCSSSWTACATG